MRVTVKSSNDSAALAHRLIHCSFYKQAHHTLEFLLLTLGYVLSLFLVVESSIKKKKITVFSFLLSVIITNFLSFFMNLYSHEYLRYFMEF